jgi:3-oxoacyl-[acyl-carrier protein] reductase
MQKAGVGSALVTGAGRGIGRAIAISLASAGFKVVVNDIPGSTDLPETLAAIKELGGDGVAVSADIADIDGHSRFVDKAWDAFGDIQCLVNNAGISVVKPGNMLDITPDSFDRLLNVNLRGPFFLTQAIARRMTQHSASCFRSIITISSANVEFTSADRAEYCISKSALPMMTQLYAARLASDGINVYEVRPGFIRTQMTAAARGRYDNLIAGGITPIARWGEPEDVSQAVTMLASGLLRYSTGETIRVDGGLAIRKL